ncbi:mandelate racemase/muconate lactonizing enzyme family protein [Tautonia rosea]|uniref:mandelate racemase/muconate lactonizing enzyme family protein n=1 Tax=Tautonia rosea TaxID=2728037 RepID=UPI0014751AF8|nr:mandelate racemase/muconate lactonizing enzyme family protein [Tautonia rosea]
MPLPKDARVVAASLYFLPIKTRVPLKFGPETLTHVTCARVKLTVTDDAGSTVEGWGETPLSVQWAWPGSASVEDRLGAMEAFCKRLAEGWCGDDLGTGHAMSLGHRFLEERLPGLTDRFNAEERSGTEAMPRLAALICASAFDLALHDAYGNLNGVPTYETYGRNFMKEDLGAFLESEPGGASFVGTFPDDFLEMEPPKVLPAWHLVGGKDPIRPEELTGDEPEDGYPVLLRDWIARDGLKCLKIKLRGNDPKWDYDRMVTIGRIAEETGVDWLSTDFNCTVQDPAYVNAILDQLMKDEPRTFGRILYVEQPFPYDLEANRIDVRSVSARKPLFMDESAHDWKLVRLGRSLGWTGVALKTCKTQTGALLSLCWAKAHGMTLMVQDLTNPMLAQIPHVLLAAHAGTIMGVETNGMQFYPEASTAEARVHPGLYARRSGALDWSSVRGSGFGYRVAEIGRALPEPAVEVG